MKKLVTFFAERSLIVNVITIMLLVGGSVSLIQMNREAFPKVEFDWIFINTLYPGASGEDIEKHITIPIEDQLREVDGIKEIYSSSAESRSDIVLQLDPDLSDKDKTINDIKDAVDSVKDLPADSEDPVVFELKSSLTPILEISINYKKSIRNDRDERYLRKHAKILEDTLRELDGVARISKTGYRDREMVVEVLPDKLDEYYIGLNDIIGAIKNNNISFPGGLVKLDKEEIMIRTIGEVNTVEDIRNILVRANEMGNWVKIKDVARVKDTFEEDDIINKTKGAQSITYTVLKKESADIITVVERVRAEIKKFEKQFGKEFEISESNDMSYYVQRRLNVLINNAIVGLILVFFSLFITLGWRISIVTVIGIPLAFGMCFIWMNLYGLSINLLTMFGLIIVLGMLVDDAIVVAENVYRHLEEGASVKDAVINGTTEVIVPVAGTILTTIAVFAPLMMMKGIMGKFMWSLPAVVSVALIASWIESMFILPSHIRDVEDIKKSDFKQKDIEKGLHHRIRDKYMMTLGFVLRNKYKFAGMITIFFLGSFIFASQQIKFILFPKGQIERFVVLAEAPTGTSLEKMSTKIHDIEKIIATLPYEDELDNFITKIGISAEQVNDPGELRGSNYATIIVNLTPEQGRKRIADDIIDYVRKEIKPYDKNFTSIKINMIRSGPPQDSPVNIVLKSDDFQQLKKIAKEYKDYLETKKGLKDIKDDYEEGKKELRIRINHQIASMTGISVFDVAQTVRTCFKGTVASTIKKSDEEIDIRVIFPEKYRSTLASVKRIKISNKRGNLIPLERVAHFITKDKQGKEIRGISVRNRNKWKRSIRITAEIDERAKGVSAVQMNMDLMKKFKNITNRYPGLIVEYAGEFKDTQESMQNLFQSFIIAIMVIYFILVVLFRSLRDPLVIMGIIPLTFVGVIWTFFFHGLPFSFLATMGVVGLAGVVVNDSIVFIDFIIKNRARGMEPFEASVKAGGHRLRPIFLTTITTFFGLIPTAYGWGGNDPFLKPMALAMSWGLFVGSFVTLFATPILYNILADIRKLFYGKFQPVEHFLQIRHDVVEEVEQYESSIKRSRKKVKAKEKVKKGSKKS